MFISLFLEKKNGKDAVSLKKIRIKHNSNIIYVIKK